MEHNRSDHISSGVSINSLGAASNPILNDVNHPDREEIRHRTFELTTELNYAMIDKLEEVIRSSRVSQDTSHSAGSLYSGYGGYSPRARELRGTNSNVTILSSDASSNNQTLKRIGSEAIMEELLIPDFASPTEEQFNILIDSSSVPRQQVSEEAKFVGADYTNRLLMEFQHPNQSFLKRSASQGIDAIFQPKVEESMKVSNTSSNPSRISSANGLIKKKGKSRKPKLKPASRTTSSVYMPQLEQDITYAEGSNTRSPENIPIVPQKESLLDKLGLTKEELHQKRITTNHTFSQQHGYTRNVGYLDLISTSNILTEKPFLLTDAETPQDYITTGVSEDIRLKQRTSYFRSSAEEQTGKHGNHGFVNLLVEYGQYLGIDKNTGNNNNNNNMKNSDKEDYSEEREMLGMSILHVFQRVEHEGEEQLRRYMAQCEEITLDFETELKSRRLKQEDTSMYTSEKLEGLLQSVPKPAEAPSLEVLLRQAAERAVTLLKEQKEPLPHDLGGYDTIEEQEQVEDAKERMKRMLLRVNTLWSNTKLALQFTLKQKKDMHNATTDPLSNTKDDLQRSQEARLLKKEEFHESKLFDFEKLHAYNLRKYLDELHQRVLPSKKAVLKASTAVDEHQALTSLGDSFLKTVQTGGAVVFSDDIEMQGDKVQIRKAGDDAPMTNAQRKALHAAMPAVYTSQGNNAMNQPAVKALRIYYSSHRSVVWRLDQQLRLCLGVAVYKDLVTETTDEQTCQDKIAGFFQSDECTCHWTPEYDERDMLLRKILDSIPLCVCGKLRITYPSYVLLHNILAQAITYTSQALAHTLQAQDTQNNVLQTLAESLTESYLETVKPKSTSKLSRMTTLEESFKTTMKSKTTQMLMIALPELSQTLPKPQHVDNLIMEDWKKDMYSDPIPCREMIAREVKHRKNIRKTLVQDYKQKKLQRAFTTRTGNTFDRQSGEEDSILTKIKNMDIPAPVFSNTEMQDFSLSMHGLRVSLFEITDQWTVGITLEEYLEFLDTMQNRVQLLLSLHTESLSGVLREEDDYQWNDMWAKKKKKGQQSGANDSDDQDSGLSDVSDTEDDEEASTSEYDSDESITESSDTETDRKIKKRLVKMPEHHHSRTKQGNTSSASSSGEYGIQSMSSKQRKQRKQSKKYQELSAFTYENDHVYVTLVDRDGNILGKINVHDVNMQFSIDPNSHRILIHDHTGRFLGYCYSRTPVNLAEGMDGYGGESGSEDDLWNSKTSIAQIYKRIEALRKEGSTAGPTTKLIVAQQERGYIRKEPRDLKDRVMYTADGRILLDTEGFSELEEADKSIGRSRKSNRSGLLDVPPEETNMDTNQKKGTQKLSKREKQQLKRLRKKEQKRREAFIDQLKGWRQDSGLYSLFSRLCADESSIAELMEKIKLAVEESEHVEKDSYAALPEISGNTSSTILKLPLSVVQSLDPEARDRILTKAKASWKQANGLDLTDDASVLRAKFNTIQEPEFVMSAEEEKKRTKYTRTKDSRKARLFILQEGLVASQPKVVSEQVDAMTGKVNEQSSMPKLTRTNSFSSLGSVITTRSVTEPSIVNPQIPISKLRNKHLFPQLEFFTRAAMALSNDSLWDDPSTLASLEAFLCNTDVDRNRDVWKNMHTRDIIYVPHGNDQYAIGNHTQNTNIHHTHASTGQRTLVIDPFHMVVKGGMEVQDISLDLPPYNTNTNETSTITLEEVVPDSHQESSIRTRQEPKPHMSDPSITQLPEEQVQLREIIIQTSELFLAESMGDQGQSLTQEPIKSTKTTESTDHWLDLTDTLVLELAMNPTKFSELLAQKAQKEAELALLTRKREEQQEKQRWLEQMKLQRGTFARNLGTYGSYRDPLEMSHVFPQVFSTVVHKNANIQKINTHRYMDQSIYRENDTDEDILEEHKATPNILKLRINPHLTPTLLLSLAQAVSTLFSKLPHAISILRAYSPQPISACLPILGESVIYKFDQSLHTKNSSANQVQQYHTQELKMEKIQKQQKLGIPRELVHQFEQEEANLLHLAEDTQDAKIVRLQKTTSLRNLLHDASKNEHNTSSLTINITDENNTSMKSTPMNDKSQKNTQNHRKNPTRHGPFGLSVQSLTTLLTSNLVSWERFFSSTQLTHVNETITRADLGYDNIMTRMLGKRRGSIMERRASLLERRDSIFDQNVDSSFSASFLQRNADLMSLTQSLTMSGGRRRGMFMPGNSAAAPPSLNNTSNNADKDENWSGVVFKGSNIPRECDLICGIPVTGAPKIVERPLLLSVLQDKLKGMKLKFLPMEVSRLRHYCKKVPKEKHKEATKGTIHSNMHSMPSTPSSISANSLHKHMLSNTSNSKLATNTSVTFGLGALGGIQQNDTDSGRSSPRGPLSSTSSKSQQLQENNTTNLLLPTSWPVYYKTCKKLAYVLHELNQACIQQSRKDNTQNHTFTNNFMALSLTSTLKHAHKAVKLCADLLILLRDQVNSIISRYVTNLNKQRMQTSQVALTPFLQKVAQMMLKKSQDVDNREGHTNNATNTTSSGGNNDNILNSNNASVNTTPDKRLSMFGRSGPLLHFAKGQNMMPLLPGNKNADATSQLIGLLETTQREELAKYLDSWTKSLAKAEETVNNIYNAVLQTHPLFTFAPMLFFGTLLDTVGKAYVEQTDEMKKDSTTNLVPSIPENQNHTEMKDKTLSTVERFKKHTYTPHLSLVKQNDNVLRADVIQHTKNYGKKESLYIPSSLTVPMEKNQNNIHIERIHPRTLQLIAEKKGLLPPSKLPEMIEIGLIDKTLPEVEEAMQYFTGEQDDILRGQDVSKVAMVTRKQKLGDLLDDKKTISGQKVLKRHKTYTKQYLETTKLIKPVTGSTRQRKLHTIGSNFSSTGSLQNLTSCSIRAKSIGNYNVDWSMPEQQSMDSEDEVVPKTNKVHTLLPQMLPNKNQKRDIQQNLEGPLINNDGKGVIGYRAASITRHHTAASIITATGIAFTEGDSQHGVEYASTVSFPAIDKLYDWTNSQRPTEGTSRSEKAGIIINDALQGQWDTTGNLGNASTRKSALTGKTTRCQVIMAPSTSTPKKTQTVKQTNKFDFVVGSTMPRRQETKESGYFGQPVKKTTISLFDFIDGQTPELKGEKEAETLLTSRSVSYRAPANVLETPNAQTQEFNNVFSKDEKVRVRRGRAIEHWEKIESDEKHLHHIIVNHKADDLLL